MPVAKKIAEVSKHSSWIRQMFEEGARLAQEHGRDKVFDFSIGNPNLEPPREFQQVIEELVLDRTPGLHGYMPNAGYDETRAAVAAYLTEDQGVAVSARHVVMTCGAGGALNIIFKAILDPGDEVIVPLPYFMEYDPYVDNHGGVETGRRAAGFRSRPRAHRGGHHPQDPRSSCQLSKQPYRAHLLKQHDRGSGRAPATKVERERTHDLPCVR